MKALRRLLCVFAVSVLFGLMLIPTAFAARNTAQTFPKLTVHVRVEVEAVPGATLPESISNLRYNVHRSVLMVDPSKEPLDLHDADDTAKIPYDRVMISGSEKDWQLASLKWTGNSSSTYCTFSQTQSVRLYGGSNEDTLWFEPDNATNPQLSIDAIIPDPNRTQRNASCSVYQYAGQGTIAGSIPAPNCIKVTDEKKDVPAEIYLVLKMKYSPTIDEKEQPEVPEPEYTKKIEPIAGKKNNYRLSLTLDTPAPDKEEDVRDIIFVVDTSGSMAYEMNGTTPEIQQLVYVWNGWYYTQQYMWVKNQNYNEENMRMKILKAKLKAMIETLADNEQDPSNPKNRVSLITFSTEAIHRATAFPANPSGLASLNSQISALQPEGGTNYYDAIQKLHNVMNSYPGSEKIVFFVTDGEPTAATPGAALGGGTSWEVGPATIFAYYAAEHLQVDRLYSLYIGNDKGGSALQGFTQRVELLNRNEDSEKFMVRAAEEAEFQTAMNRFMTFIDKSIYNVKIVDTLSEYVEFADNMDIRVIAKTTDLNGKVTERELVNGVDYRLYSDAGAHDNPDETYTNPNFKNKKTIQLKLLNNALQGTVYTLSFNVQASGKAMKTLYENLDEDGGFNESLYPDTGDPETGAYSLKRGFYSNSDAKVSFFYQGQNSEKVYPHPVIQVQPDVKNAEIRLKKKLEGKELKTGEFEFELFDKNGNRVGNPVKNGNPETNDPSDVIFTELNIKRAGDYEFTAKEVIPSESERAPGYQYDDSEKKVKLSVSYNPEKRQLEATVNYVGDYIFRNKYQAEPVKLSLEAQKILVGKLDLVPGMFNFKVSECDENFNFVDDVYLKDDNGEFVLDESGNKIRLEATNGVEGDPGKIVFKPIVFTKPGTYYYQISEIVLPSIENVTYDTSKKKVIVTIVDENAKLKVASVEFVKNKPEDDGKTFKNTYTVPDPNAQIKIPTVVTGKRLLSGMFNYDLYLYDEENGRQGEVVKKDVGNNKNGYVYFNLEAKYDEESGRIGLKLPEWKGNEIVVEPGKEETPTNEGEDPENGENDENGETGSTVEVDENGITWFSESVTLTFLAKQITPEEGSENFDDHMKYDEDKEIIVHLKFVLKDGIFEPEVKLSVKGDETAEAKFINIYNIRGDIR